MFECEVCVNGIRLEHVSKFKYLGCVLGELGTYEAECSGRMVAGAIRSLVNARSLQLVYAKVLHESLLVSVLTYGRETMIWREKERSWISVVQMDNLRGLLVITRMDEVSIARIRQLFGGTKGVEEKMVEGVLQWSDHFETIENDTIAKRVYVGECAGSCSVGRPRKR